MKTLVHKFIVSPSIMRASAEAAPATMESISAELTTALEEFSTRQEESDASVQALITASDETSAEALKKSEEAIEATKKAAANLEEIQQKLADGIKSGDKPVPGTVGDVVIANANYVSMLDRCQGSGRPESSFSLRIEANTLTGQTSGGASSDILVPEHRRPGIISGAWRSLRIRDLLPTIPITSNSYEYTRELLFTNAAAGTKEGAAKPESTLTFELDDTPIRTIAHWIKASNQILMDAPALRAYIDGRMSYGVDLKEDKQLMNGDGTGQDLSGMVLPANHTAFEPTATEQELDGLNRAKTAIITADYMADGVVMNPEDWGRIERLKNDDKGYLVGNPFGTIIPMIWGLPVVLSNSVVSGKFMMAAFAMSFEYVSRQSTVIDLGFDGNDFTKNLVTIRAEKRCAIASIRPASARYGSLKA